MGCVVHELPGRESRMDTTDVYAALRDNLVERITSDKRYMEQRLGRVASDNEVLAAITPQVLNQAMEAVSYALDPVEAEVWTALGESA
jgi:hypothetical protein